MSSIAYITDNNMLEFHRIHGHKTMNFWRFDSKQFSAFTKGDLLFFLVKKSERPNSTEKGILGCGRLEINQTTSLKRMWDNYGQLNGYNTFSELRETIKRLSKENKMPRSMNCLFLTDVIYFNEPLYLSDFGINVSNYMESYTYLNNFDENIENKLLGKAKNNGVDIWASILSDSNDLVFEKQLIINQINELHRIINDLKYDKKQYKTILKIAKNFNDENEDFSLFKNSDIEFYKIEYNTVTFVLINIAKENNSDEYKRLIGHLVLIKDKCNEFEFEVKFKIIDDLSESLISYLGE
jgi:hypothetical protein